VFGIERPALAVDFGSSYVAVARGGVIPLLRERSRVAFSFRKSLAGATTVPFSEGQVLAVGAQGEEECLNRPQTTRLAVPVTEGRLREPYAATQLLKSLFHTHQLASWRTRLFGGTVMILVPPDVRDLEKKAWIKAGEALNCGRVLTVDSLNAAIVGIGLDIREPRGQMVMDIGGGATRVALYSLSEKVALTCVPVGGDHLDRAILDYLRKRYRMNPSLQQVEAIRMTLGSVFPKARPEFMELSGADTSTGIVKKVTLDDNEIRDALLNACEPLIGAITQTFEQVPPELAADVAREAVTLIGGGALLSGLTSFLSERTGVSFRLAEDPQNAALRGALRLLTQPLKPSLEPQ